MSEESSQAYRPMYTHYRRKGRIIDIGADPANYFCFHLLRIFGWRLCLHVWTPGPNPERELWDDHKWDFWTLCVWGRATEQCLDGDDCLSREICFLDLIYRRAETKHRLIIHTPRMVSIALKKPPRRKSHLYEGDRYIET